jgi:hypothetical protein
MGEETTITVRGVDLEVWKEFQKSIIDKYGDIYGKLGPEVTNALRNWLEKGSSEPPKIDFTKYSIKVGVPRVLDPNGGMSVRQLILDAMKAKGSEAYIQEVISYIHGKYGPVNPNTISTAMSDLAVNGPPSSLYPMEQRFLRRVSRGRYRLEKEDC